MIIFRENRKHNHNFFSVISDDMRFISKNFEGGSYLLSEELPLVDINDYQNFCVRLGGYLAEINTQEEYDFIMAFLKESIPSGREEALLGATDENNEGEWVFMNSRLPVTYFNWFSSHGARGPGNDCMYLIWNTEEGMHDWKCYNSGTRRYLCEFR